MSQWTSICPAARLPVERGVAALLDGEQVAVFRTADNRLHAVSNHDPFSGAMVISRGIVGSRGERSTVASPVYKQVFDLETGQCLDDSAVRLEVHPVRVLDGVVQVALRAQALSA
ncbi:MAG: nitrite reductase small subunit NirD [Actinomycetota bacterium]|nr:nitrite reductase small subunit NirD [Actinomycetota bacterium]